MKIALFGSTGRIGTRILNEALARGHQVTAVVRDASRPPFPRTDVEVKTGDVLKRERGNRNQGQSGSDQRVRSRRR